MTSRSPMLTDGGQVIVANRLVDDDNVFRNEVQGNSAALLARLATVETS